MSATSLPSPMCSAALQYARRGWAIFPCRERDGEAYVDRKTLVEKRAKAKQPYVGNGLKDATTDEQRITNWWTRYPQAMIAVPQGINGMFVVDFDPREVDVFDPLTGEVELDGDGNPVTRLLTLEELKAALEEQMGCALPRSVTAMTPSGGVHVYFRQPAGEPIKNRGNLPEHVDVRGQGGYTIVSPSSCIEAADSATGNYRWLRDRGDWRNDADFAEAPAALIEILRAPKVRPGASPVDRASPASPWRSSPARAAMSADDDIRKYGLTALDGECRAIRQAGSGKRNAQLNESALKVASLVAAGALDASIARISIESAARDNPGRDDDAQLLATIQSGWTAGEANPRDLSEIAASSRARRDRASSGSSRPSPPGPDTTVNGKPSSHSGGSADDVGGRGREGQSEKDLTQECAHLPQTDLGNLQRFLRRYGRDFLYVEQWGWLAWDGKRWNRDMAVAMLGRAVQDTMRAIQDEAALIAASGIPSDPLPLWDVEQVRAHEAQQKGKLDRVVDVKKVILFSDTIRKWGRASEGAGHISCIAKLAEARLSARPDDFDADILRLNVQNGTLLFTRPEHGRAARFELLPHSRRDKMTKVAEVQFDPRAICPLYVTFIERVQPSADMREFLDTWAGYNMLGDVSAQKFALFYGEGSNGKSVWMDVKAHILGDYSWVTGIETFIDQGKYRKGSDASPDLAAMAGRRMVRSSEPEEGSKFSDGLIKALTGSEPIPVRELMKSPFNMRPTFKATVAANNRPKIGTDHGIQRRMMLVPWEVIIPDAEVDLQLPTKLKAEASGILNRMIAGALIYLDRGLKMPEAVIEATREYQDENDVLGQFVDLCLERTEGETIGATPLHRLFAAWQTWANLLPATGKPWSPKYLNAQMTKKRFKIRKSSTMLWQDVHALFDEHDFIDSDGKPVTRALPEPRTANASDAPRPFTDDDMPP